MRLLQSSKVGKLTTSLSRSPLICSSCYYHCQIKEAADSHHCNSSVGVFQMGVWFARYDNYSIALLARMKNHRKELWAPVELT